MHQLVTIAVAVMALARPDAGELRFQDSKEAKGGPGAKASKIVPTSTEAALRFFVIEKDKGPVKGVVIRLTTPAGAKYYTEETDDDGYAEVLVPVGQKYEVTYLSLGLARGDIVATESVSNEPRQSIKLTLRYKRLPPPPPNAPPPWPPPSKTTAASTAPAATAPARLPTKGTGAGRATTSRGPTSSTWRATSTTCPS